jgi:hypothetical protein
VIDTAAKRRSVAGVPFHPGLGVTPNALKDAAWRQQVAWSYSGIAAGGTPPVTETLRMDHRFMIPRTRSV